MTIAPPRSNMPDDMIHESTSQADRYSLDRMIDSQWLTELQEWVDRQPSDLEPVVLFALRAHEMMSGVSDRHLLAAFNTTDGRGLFAEALLSEIEARRLDV